MKLFVVILVFAALALGAGYLWFNTTETILPVTARPGTRSELAPDQKTTVVIPAPKPAPVAP